MFGSLAPDSNSWASFQRAVSRFMRDHPVNQAIAGAYRQIIPPGKPEWYNPQPRGLAGEIVTPDFRAEVQPFGSIGVSGGAS
jgi:hypothetical protein